MEFEFTSVLDTIDAVPEDFRGLYAKDEKEGKFKLASDKPEVKSAVAAIVGLNNALKAARAEVKAIKEKAKGVDLSPLSEFGSSPEEIQAKFKAKIDELQAGKPNVEKLKQEFAQAHAKELQDREKRLEALTGQLHRLLIDGEVTKSAAEHTKTPDLLLPFVKNQVRVIEENGAIEVRVVDSAGDPRYSGVTGKPMTVAELVKEMKTQERYGRLFDSEALSGGGSRPPAPAGRAPNTTSDDKLSPVEKIKKGLGALSARR